MKKAHAYFTRKQRREAKKQFNYEKNIDPTGYEEGKSKFTALVVDKFVRHCNFNCRLGILR